MDQLSTKQKLIASLETDRILFPDMRLEIDSALRQLRNRGSGPLPSHLLALARRRGLVA